MRIFVMSRGEGIQPSHNVARSDRLGLVADAMGDLNMIRLMDQFLGGGAMSLS